MEIDWTVRIIAVNTVLLGLPGHEVWIKTRVFLDQRYLHAGFFLVMSVL